MKHLFLHGIDFNQIELNPVHEEWLIDWLKAQENDIDCGCVSSSICLIGLIAEILVKGKPEWDWLNIVRNYLTNSEDLPIAYSESFGRKLYKFEQQWQQTTIHAIHARWFIESFYQQPNTNNIYGELIKNFCQPDGWFYNPQVSQTRKATRMKSEYLMSFAMSIEILKEANILSNYADRLKATIGSETFTLYISSEYFRLLALEFLEARFLRPSEIHTVLLNTEVSQGYCDFAVEEKRDDYMGTVKRSSRDRGRHSAIASFQATKIANYCQDDIKEYVNNRLRLFAKHIEMNPLDIPAFKIRDLVGIPFGLGLTPLEVITASVIINLYG